MIDESSLAAEIRQAIVDRGYLVVDRLIPEADVAALRDFWLAAFSANPAKAPIIWTPYLGEPNRVLFHGSGDSCLYRSYDFLWNPALHGKTRELGLRLNRLRNRAAEAEALHGETFAADRYGIYITTSYYPPSTGEMTEHRDFTDGRRHWHFVLPLTFRGSDFSQGGLILIDRQGQAVDLEALLKPGSVIFYDGSLPHRVARIEGSAESALGRLQMFAIPTFFALPEASERFAERLPLGRYLKDRLRPLKRKLIG